MQLASSAPRSNFVVAINKHSTVPKHSAKSASLRQRPSDILAVNGQQSSPQNLAPEPVAFGRAPRSKTLSRAVTPSNSGSAGTAISNPRATPNTSTPEAAHSLEARSQKRQKGAALPASARRQRRKSPSNDATSRKRQKTTKPVAIFANLADQAAGEPSANPAAASFDPDQEYVVEKLEDHRIVTDPDTGIPKLVYKVRWEGDWPPDQKHTWEPEENIMSDSMLRKYKKKVLAKGGRKAMSLQSALRALEPDGGKDPTDVSYRPHKRVKQKAYSSVADAFGDVDDGTAADGSNGAVGMVEDDDDELVVSEEHWDIARSGGGTTIKRGTLLTALTPNDRGTPSNPRVSSRKQGLAVASGAPSPSKATNGQGNDNHRMAAVETPI
jgi:hypothetical protein